MKLLQINNLGGAAQGEAEKVIESIEFSWGSLLGVIIVFVFTWFVLRLIRKFINRPIRGKEVDRGRRHSVFLIIKYVLWVIAIVFCFELLGIDSTFLLTSSAALLVGLGLGIQNIFNDFVSGVIILFDGTLEIGDIVEVDGMVCQVKKITLRNSKVMNRDDKIIIVPNRKFVNENVVNWSHHDLMTRFIVSVGVHYKEDENLVRAALLQAMNDTPKIVNYKGYAPFVRFKEFGDSTLVFEAIFWSKEIFRIENVQSDLRFNIRRRFRENNIEIAFPQLDIHLRSDVREVRHDDLKIEAPDSTRKLDA